MDQRQEIDFSKIHRVLVCIFKYHGDVLLTSPLYTTLRRALPKAKIDVYLFKDTLPMLEGHPAIDEFITYDQAWRKLPKWKRLMQELSMWIKIRRRKYDLVINMTSGDRGSIMARVSGAPVRVGIEPEGGLPRKKKLFTQIISKTRTSRHIVERNYDSLRAIGILPLEEERDLYFHIPEKARQRVRELIPYKEFILIHPASRCDFKHWPAEKFAALIRYLKERGDNIVISGGPGKEEKAFIEKILSHLPGEEILNLAGKTNLKELGAMIERAKLLISVDSVPPHISSALKKPVVVIFGPSDDIKWGPWRNPHARVVRLDVPCKRCDNEGCGGSWYSDCLTHLPVNQVIRTVESLLAAESPREPAQV